MINANLLWRLILGKPKHPYIKNLRQSRDDSLYFDSLTRGTLVTGNPGTGKTRWTAGFMLDFALKFPDRPIFIFDASGSLTNDFIGMYHTLDREQFEAIDRRVVLDMPGHEDLVIPKPMFHSSYGLTNEELVKRAVEVGKQLSPEEQEKAPVMSDSLSDTAPMLYRLLMAIRNEYQESWQITEAKKFLIDRYKGGLLETAVKRYGQWAGGAKWWFENTLLRNDVSRQDVAAWTKVLLNVLSTIETDPLRARYGHYRPGVTAKEVIEKGYIYIVSGEFLANHLDAQAFVFWDEFLFLRTLINKRTPHDTKEKPVLLVIDEVYRLFEIPGMAKALGEISNYFRNRKLMPVIVIQSFWQLTKLLKKQIWSLGNIVSFAMDDMDDAFDIAYQLFKYNRQAVKFEAPREGANATAENDRGQYLEEADWIQDLQGRQVFMRRYQDENTKERFINFVERTKERPIKDLPIEDVKLEIFKRRAEAVRPIVKEINNRKLTLTTEKRRTV